MTKLDMSLRLTIHEGKVIYSLCLPACSHTGATGRRITGVLGIPGIYACS